MAATAGRARLGSAGGEGAVDDGEQLADRVLEVVVDDEVVGEGASDRLLVLGLLEAGEHLVGGVAPLAQAAFLLLARRRQTSTAL